MKERLKRCLSIGMAVCMVFTMPVQVFAENNSVNGEEESCAVEEDEAYQGLFAECEEVPMVGASAEIQTGQKVTGVSLHDHNSAAITEGGDLYCWGWNDYGQVGNGTTQDQRTPVKILGDVKSVLLGGGHSAAITEGGDLYCWGRNDYGQVGSGTTQNQHTPVKILEDVKSVSLGGQNSAAITEDGDLYCWGANGRGQVGNGTTKDQLEPVKVLGDVKSVSLGTARCAAITKGGDLYQWGAWGNFVSDSKLKPVKILEDVKSVLLAGGHGAAITEGKNLYCWGWNYYGQVGNGTTEDQFEPVKVLGDVKSVSLGTYISSAIMEGGDLYCWGWNYNGPIGDGTNASQQLKPVKILEDVKSVSFGHHHGAAITEGGNLYCWGGNYYGQVGNGEDGTEADQLKPVKILEDVKSVSLGAAHSAAITEGGSLYCWGKNCDGQIGDGTTQDQLTPVKIIIGSSLSDNPNSSNPLPEVTTEKLFSSDLKFRVTDRLKKQNVVAMPSALEGVNIEVEGIGQAVTDVDGKATIQNTSQEGAVKSKIVLSKEGYRQYIFEHVVYHKDKDLLWDINNIYAQMTELQEGDNEKPYVSTLMCTTMNNEKAFDAMTVSQKYKQDVGQQKLSLQMNAVWNGKTPQTYILYQKDGPSYESADGKFSVDMGKFVYGKPVYAKLVATDGTTVEQKTEFQIEIDRAVIYLPDDNGEEMQLIQSDSTGSLGTDVAFFAGEEMSLNLKTKIKVKVEQDKVRVTIGKTLGKSEEFSNKEWEDWKKLCETQPYDLDFEQWKNVVDSLEMDWTRNFKTELQVYGYLEGTKKDSGDTLVSGKLTISGSLEDGFQTQYTVGVIPVYAKISFGLKGEVGGAFSYNLTQKQIMESETGIILKFEPSLGAEAGMGVMSVATVGVKGTGSAPMEANVTGKPEDTKLSIKGGMSLEASVFKFKYTQEIVSRTWKLLPKKDKDAKSVHDFSAENFKLAKRENVSSDWLGGKGLNARIKSARKDDTTEKMLEIGVYKDSEMQIVDNGTTRMLVWTEDDAGRSNINGSKLVYSIYDSSKDIWSAPKAIADDGTADYAPTVVSDSEHIYVAWQNMNKAFDDAASLKEVASAGEIVLATWTKADGFSAPMAVSETGHMAAAPVVRLDAAGNPFITYLQNTEDDILFTSGKNNIMYSVVRGNDVEYKSFVKNAGLVMAYDTIYTNDYEISYTIDTDNDLATLEDREIITRKGGTVNTTRNDCMDSNASYVNNGGSPLRFWYRDNSICMADDKGKESVIYQDETGSLSDDFHVIHGTEDQMAIVWTKTDANGIKQVEGILYDHEKNTWSKSVQISDTDASVYNPMGIFDKDGSLLFVFKKDKETKTDLCALKAKPYVNLTLKNAYCDESEFVAGNAADTYILVENNGTKRIDQYTVDVGGTKTQISTSLEPGDTEIVKADYSVPANLDYGDVKITAQADGDADNTDNSYTIQLGHPDFAINLLQNKYDFGHLIEARISNENIVPADAVLEIRRGSRDGELVKRIDLGMMGKDEATDVTYIWNEASENYSSDTETLYFDVITEKGETYKDNNYDFVVIDNSIETKGKNVKVQSVSIQSSASIKDGDALQMTATVLPSNATKKTLKWSSDNTAVAVVDQNGLVTAVGEGKATITASSTDGSNISASCVISVTKRSGGGGSTAPTNPTGPSGPTTPTNPTTPTTPSDPTKPGGGDLEPTLLYYIVKFNANGGKNLSRKTMTLLNDDNLGILPKTTRKNYTFKGWYTQKTGGKKVTKSTVLNAATTLYAHWTKVTKPAQVLETSLKISRKGRLIVGVKKVKGAKGYEIAYSTNKKFPSSSTKKVRMTALKKTLKNLKSGKTYYVKIRAYKTDSAGNRIYGAYSWVNSIEVW